MESPQDELVLTLEVVGVPDELLVDRSASLLEDLREISGARLVTLAPGAGLPGAKSFETTLALGAAAVAILPTVLPILLQTLQAWLNAQTEAKKLKVQVSDGKRSITLEYAAGALSTEQLDQLITSLTDKATGRR
jgi:hypothetical protein